MLTEAQKRHFETFGFLIIRQLFTQNEIDLIRRESDRLLAANRQGKAFSATKRQSIIPFFERSPVLLPFIADDRLHAIATSLLGPDYILNASEGNLHVGDTRWHGGSVDEILPHIKIAFYLEPTTKNTGALRLMPGSHKAAFNGHLQPLSEENGGTETMPFSVPQDQLPCVVFESQPGDVGIFSECTWHAAFGGAPGRSQHAISYQANPQNDAQLAYLKELCAKYKYSLHPPEEMVKSDNPRIQNMISRLLELGVGPPEPMPIFEG